VVFTRKIDENQMKKIKDFIFNNSRLLERKLFSFFFEKGKKSDVIKALVAYQNSDGGFGNGIEPDLLCPDSSAIGAETAMYYFDLLDDVDNQSVNQLIKWIIKVQNEEGIIDHPPKNMYNYPFQKWWDGPDDLRIFAISGFLKKWGVENSDFFKKVNKFYAGNPIPTELKQYEYPYFMYLKYFGQGKEEKEILQRIISQLPSIFEENKAHYLLFGRHWYHALDNVSKEVFENEAENFFSGLEDDGGLKIIYQDLPWWRPIWTLDSLILLKKSNMIDF
jgi:hypothetical protein